MLILVDALTNVN